MEISSSLIKGCKIEAIAWCLWLLTKVVSLLCQKGHQFDFGFIKG